MRFPDSYVGAPVRSLQVMLATLARAGENIPVVVSDGVYGEQTAAAVRAFQKNRGLEPTGEADNDTWNRIVDSYDLRRHFVLPAEPLQIVWQPLDAIRPGDKNRNLYPLQALFCALKEVYPEVPALDVSGVHEGGSVAAVRWFQTRSGLPADGILTQVEWRLLVKLYRLAVGDGTDGPENPDAVLP